MLQGSEFLDNWFDKGIVTRIPLEQIPVQRISFTYGDSMTALKKKGGFDMLTEEMLIRIMANYNGTLEEFIQEVNREYSYYGGSGLAGDELISITAQTWQEVG